MVFAAAILAVAGCATAHGSVPDDAAGPYQFGLDLDFYWHPGMDVPGDITADAAYARRLGAAAVQISFPFFSVGGLAGAGPPTPPPLVLQVAIAAARAQGLAVYVRPLLNEQTLGQGRADWRPPDVASWFASYQDFLLPYAQAAASAGVAGIYAGTELDAIDHDPQWTTLDASLARLHPGKLYYAINWPHVPVMRGSGGPASAITVTVNAYPELHVPVSRFTAAWANWAARLPRRTILSEVGIAERAGAQNRPWFWNPATQQLDPAEQTAWFTAACHAVTTDHLGGIYFWDIPVGASLDVPPTAATTSSQFTDSPGAAAIGSCFDSLRGH
jgi:hypothetical protein